MINRCEEAYGKKKEKGNEEMKRAKMASTGLLFVLSPMERYGAKGREVVVRIITSSLGGLSRVSRGEPLIDQYVSALLDQEDTSQPTAAFESGECARYGGEGRCAEVVDAASTMHETVRGDDWRPK